MNSALKNKQLEIDFLNVNSVYFLKNQVYIFVLIVLKKDKSNLIIKIKNVIYAFVFTITIIYNLNNLHLNATKK